MIDTNADFSCISSSALSFCGLTSSPGSQFCQFPNGTSTYSSSFVSLTFQLSSEKEYTGIFWVLPSTTWQVILGVPELSRLPLQVHLEGVEIFKGADTFQTLVQEPELPLGEGIKFQGGSPDQQTAVQQVLLRHKDAIFEWSGRYGMFQNHAISLELSDNVPVTQRPYRLNPQQTQAAAEILQEYSNRGLIEPSNSAYSAPAFLVPKKHAPGDPTIKKWRMVEDYREINKKLHYPQTPVPIVQDLLDQLGAENVFFCSIDLKQGYHHVPIVPKDRHKTAFSASRYLHQYKVLPYGFKSAPRIFQDVMQTILRPLLGKGCLVYIDDVII